MQEEIKRSQPDELGSWQRPALTPDNADTGRPASRRASRVAGLGKTRTTVAAAAAAETKNKLDCTNEQEPLANHESRRVVINCIPYPRESFVGSRAPPRGSAEETCLHRVDDGSVILLRRSLCNPNGQAQAFPRCDEMS